MKEEEIPTVRVFDKKYYTMVRHRALRAIRRGEDLEWVDKYNEMSDMLNEMRDPYRGYKKKRVEYILFP